MTPPSGTTGTCASQSTFSSQMSEMQAESEQESEIEMKTNLIINRSNALAQTAQSVGRGS